MFKLIPLLRCNNRLGRRFFSTTIYDKIITKEIPSDILFEDDFVLVFKDIKPVAPFHYLIIPKRKDGLTGISQAEERHVEILGRLLLSAKKVGKLLGVQDGYRIVINDGKHAGQTVSHLHLHFLAGKQFSWPPGTDSNNPKI
jgi:diadenosine tetraphosphate (Ap4A) HIT family hydrolase